MIRKEASHIKEMLEHWNYVCVWRDSMPLFAVDKRASLIQISNYLNKYSNEGDFLWFDGTNSEQSDL